jgi:ketosteroid isomerase-like protein
MAHAAAAGINLMPGREGAVARCSGAGKMQLAEANFAQNESVTFSPINPQCRVIGSTGIVWGHTALTRKPKDGPVTTLFARFTFIFVKTDAQWREAAVHVSQLPTAG